MAKITEFKGYAGENPQIPRPSEPVEPNIVTVQEGVPGRDPGRDGLGVRVVHPVTPRSPARAPGQEMFYCPRRGSRAWGGLAELAAGVSESRSVERVGCCSGRVGGHCAC